MLVVKLTTMGGAVGCVACDGTRKHGSPPFVVLDGQPTKEAELFWIDGEDLERVQVDGDRWRAMEQSCDDLVADLAKVVRALTDLFVEPLSVAVFGLAGRPLASPPLLG